MKEYIEERAIAITNYIINHNATVGQAAKKSGVSESIVHENVTNRLEHINPTLAAQVRIVLDVNRSERRIRGGLAIKEKYQHRLQTCSREIEEQQPDKDAFVGRRIFLVCNCILLLMSAIQKNGGYDERDGRRI